MNAQQKCNRINKYFRKHNDLSIIRNYQRHKEKKKKVNKYSRAAKKYRKRLTKALRRVR